MIKNYNIPIPRPPLRTSKLHKKPSALKSEHPELQNMKFLNFILHLWVIIGRLDPDSEYGSGSTDLESGSETLTEVQPWQLLETEEEDPF